MKLYRMISGPIKYLWLEGNKFNYKLEFMTTGGNFHVIPTFHIYLEAFSYKYDGIYIGLCWLSYRLTLSRNMDTRKWCERNNVK